MKTIHLTIYGRPQAKGSKRAFNNKHTGKAMLQDMNPKARDWQAAVSAAAGEEYQGPLLYGPVRVSATFCFARPKSHYRTGKYSTQLRADAPFYHINVPDTDKIVRTLCDGLSGIVFKDDKQVQLGPCGKVWKDRDVTAVTIEELGT